MARNPGGRSRAGEERARGRQDAELEGRGGGEEKLPAEEGGGERTRAHPTFRPRVDIFETENGLTLVADMPGVPPDNADIRLEKRELTIHGRVEDAAPEGYSPVYREYEVGDFERRFTLGGDFDPERIEAELRDGVLTLTIPRSQEAAARTIKIRSGG
jgi:HSP20 family protein